MPTHPGYLPRANHKGARVKELIASPPGILFSAESFTLGLHDNITIDIDSISVNDAGKRNITDQRMVNITGSSLQCNWAKVKDAFLLTQAPFQVRARMLDDYYYNFNETVATQYLGGGFKVEIDQAKRILNFFAKGRISLADSATLQTASTAAHTGETGGSTLGLTGAGYARSGFTNGNFRSLQVTNSSGAALIGAFREITFTLESMGVEDHLDRPLPRKYKYTLAGVGLQTLKGDYQAWEMDMGEDTVALATLFNNDTIKINQAAGTAKFMAGDENRWIEFEFTGECSANTADATPNSVDIGVTSATQLELTMIGAS